MIISARTFLRAETPTHAQCNPVESMNHRDGDVGVRKLNHGCEDVVAHALPKEREHLALGLQKGLDDSLDVHKVEVDTLGKRRDMHLAVTNRVDLGRRGANLVLVSNGRGPQHSRAIHIYLVEVSGTNVLCAPIRSGKLDIVVDVAGVPDVGKMKEDVAVSENGVPFALTRRPKLLQLLRRVVSGTSGEEEWLKKSHRKIALSIRDVDRAGRRPEYDAAGQA